MVTSKEHFHWMVGEWGGGRFREMEKDQLDSEEM